MLITKSAVYRQATLGNSTDFSLPDLITPLEPFYSTAFHSSFKIVSKILIRIKIDRSLNYFYHYNDNLLFYRIFVDIF